MNERRIHQIFEVSILLKGAHALIECAGGIAFALISTRRIAAIADRLTQAELIEDPHDFLATHLLAWAQHVSVGSKRFYAFYLLAHGVIKIFLVAGLLRGRLWAYPASIAVLGLFILYQIWRFMFTHGAGLIVLSMLDVLVLWLIWHEYRLIRQHPPPRLSGAG